MKLSEIKWIKLGTHMFEDEKIRIIEKMPESDTILIIWVKLLAQAGKVNASGYIFLSENIPYTDEMLATIFDRPIGTVRMALETFKKFGMIDIDQNHFICINNWEKHQNIEGMERVKKLNAERNKRYRERQKEQLTSGKKDSDVSVTSRDGTDIDKELDIDKEKDINNNVVRDLFDHYLSFDIIKHQKITSPMRSAVNRRLKDYSFDQLKQAITNYAHVYKSENHWFTQKYTFADLMRDKDVRKFIDEADPINNFKNKGVESNASYSRSHAGSYGKGKSYAEAERERLAAEEAWGGV